MASGYFLVLYLYRRTHCVSIKTKSQEQQIGQQEDALVLQQTQQTQQQQQR